MKRVGVPGIADDAIIGLVMNGSFWIGVYPGLRDAMIEYMVHSFASFFRHMTPPAVEGAGHR